MGFSFALMIWGNYAIEYTRGIAEQVMNPGHYINAVLNHRPLQGG